MRVLIADDERDIADAIAIILQYSGFDSDVVYDGEAASRMMEKQDYDAAILDIMMPKMDGIEVLNDLRSRGDVTPVLLLTAKAEVEDRILGLEQGADDYLAKPFDKGELIARIKVMVRRKSTYDSGNQTCGNTTLDTEHLEMSNGDVSLRLSGREVEILSYLMRNNGKRISFERLTEYAWRGETYTEGSLILYLGYLRNKLQAIHSDLILIQEGENVMLMRKE